MRCTRCDRPAVPQALARDPQGRLVFGWCQECLEWEDCTQIRIAVPVKRRRRLWSGPVRLSLTEDRARPEPRARALKALAAGLAGWSLILLSLGLSRTVDDQGRLREGIGPGVPWFFFVASLALGVTSLGVFVAPHEGDRRRRIGLRLICVIGAVLGVASLLGGVVWHHPRRDPWIAMVAIGSMSAAALASRRLSLERMPSPQARPVEIL